MIFLFKLENPIYFYHVETLQNGYGAKVRHSILQVMTKKEISKLHTAIAKWDDTVTEDEIIEKFKVTDSTLRKMRREGRIKNFRYVTPSKTENKERPGRKPVYSLIEITDLFCPQATA